MLRYLIYFYTCKPENPPAQFCGANATRCRRFMFYLRNTLGSMTYGGRGSSRRAGGANRFCGGVSISRTNMKEGSMAVSLPLPPSLTQSYRENLFNELCLIFVCKTCDKSWPHVLANACRNLLKLSLEWLCDERSMKLLL